MLELCALQRQPFRFTLNLVSHYCKYGFSNNWLNANQTEQGFSLKGSDRGPSQEDVGAFLKAGKIGTCTSTIYNWLNYVGSPVGCMSKKWWFVMRTKVLCIGVSRNGKVYPGPSYPPVRMVRKDSKCTDNSLETDLANQGRPSKHVFMWENQPSPSNNDPTLQECPTKRQAPGRSILENG